MLCILKIKLKPNNCCLFCVLNPNTLFLVSIYFAQVLLKDKIFPSELQSIVDLVEFIDVHLKKIQIRELFLVSSHF